MDDFRSQLKIFAESRHSSSIVSNCSIEKTKTVDQILPNKTNSNEFVQIPIIGNDCCCLQVPHENEMMELCDKYDFFTNLSIFHCSNPIFLFASDSERLINDVPALIPHEIGIPENPTKQLQKSLEMQRKLKNIPEGSRRDPTCSHQQRLEKLKDHKCIKSTRTIHPQTNAPIPFSACYKCNDFSEEQLLSGYDIFLTCKTERERNVAVWNHIKLNCPTVTSGTNLRITHYKVFGHLICRDFFLLWTGFSTRKLTRLLKYGIDTMGNILIPKPENPKQPHQRTGIILDFFQFVLTGSLLELDPSARKKELLPLNFTKKQHLYLLYRDRCTKLNIKPDLICERKYFEQVWNSKFPQIKIQTRSYMECNSCDEYRNVLADLAIEPKNETPEERIGRQDNLATETERFRMHVKRAEEAKTLYKEDIDNAHNQTNLVLQTDGSSSFWVPNSRRASQFISMGKKFEIAMRGIMHANKKLFLNYLIPETCNDRHGFVFSLINCLSLILIPTFISKNQTAQIQWSHCWTLSFMRL